jgi:hypothetical protein
LTSNKAAGVRPVPRMISWTLWEIIQCYRLYPRALGPVILIICRLSYADLGPIMTRPSLQIKTSVEVLRCHEPPTPPVRKVETRQRVKLLDCLGNLQISRINGISHVAMFRCHELFWIVLSATGPLLLAIGGPQQPPAIAIKAAMHGTEHLIVQWNSQAPALHN